MFRISKSKYSLTFENEIGVGSTRPHHPSSTSGVTIGCGYDFKHKKPNRVEVELEKSGFNTDYIKRFKKACGLKGSKAKQFCEDNKDLKITESQQEALFLVLSRVYETKAIKDYNNMFKSAPAYEDLPQEIKTLIFDFTYNLGSINEFPKFFNALLSGNRKIAYENYKRFTGGVPLGRRNKDTKRMLDAYMFKDIIGSYNN